MSRMAAASADQAIERGERMEEMRMEVFMRGLCSVFCEAGALSDLEVGGETGEGLGQRSEAMARPGGGGCELRRRKDAERARVARGQMLFDSLLLASSVVRRRCRR